MGVTARSIGRKEMDFRNSDRPPRKGDFVEELVSQDRYRFSERRDRSWSMKVGKESMQKRGASKRGEKDFVDLKAVKKECQLQNFQQKRKLPENNQKKDRLIRRHSSTSTVSTASNASESKTVDTSLGLLTQHPLLPNVFILDPKTQK